MHISPSQEELLSKKSTPIKKMFFKIPRRLALRTSPFRKEKPTKCRKFSNLAAKMDSRWPVRRLEHVAEVIVEALKEKRAANNIGSSGREGSLIVFLDRFIRCYV